MNGFDFFNMGIMLDYKLGQNWTAHLLCLFARFVVKQHQQVHYSLSQELVQPHRRPVHSYDVKSAAFSVARVEEWQVKRSLFFPYRADAFLNNRGGKFVFGDLNDCIAIAGAIFAFATETPSLMHRHLDTRGKPRLALGSQWHVKSSSQFGKDIADYTIKYLQIWVRVYCVFECVRLPGFSLGKLTYTVNKQLFVKFCIDLLPIFQ